uniref:WD repeat-containing protein 89 n=2 Tax=Arion vulgaris TaxID=1028688 RepID=A0A0B7ABB3_9EUPU
MILFGDDARNIKLLDWKKGLVTKLSNHTNSFSFTDALSCHGELLLSSSYDLDQGLGYINIRSSRRFEYLATIDDESTERIVCLDFGYSSSNNLFVVTGGMDLKLWQVLPAQSVNKSTEQVDEDIFQLEFRPALAQLAVDSETESSNDDSDYEDESYGSEPGKVRSDISSNGWLSWCTLL